MTPVERTPRVEHWNQSALDRAFGAYRASEHGFRMVFEDFPDELSTQLRGQWLNPGVRLAICLRFAFVDRIAVEDDGIGAAAQNFQIADG